MLRLMTRSLCNTAAVSGGAITLAVCGKRNLCVATTAQSKSADGSSDHGRGSGSGSDSGDDEKSYLQAIKPEVLLSDANRQRFLKRMQKASSLGLREPDNNPEQPLAAVLICICTNMEDDVSLLYTRRSSRLSRHTSQISFPGGIKDPDDSSFVDCALRETEEEVGLPRSRVQIWGTGKLIKPPRTAAIMPVVGMVENFDLCELNINADEVEEAFVIPIRCLVHPGNVRHTQFKAGYSSPTFVVDHYRVWGVTGFITNSFLNCLIPIELERLKDNVKYIKPYKRLWE